MICNTNGQATASSKQQRAASDREGEPTNPIGLCPRLQGEGYLSAELMFGTLQCSPTVLRRFKNNTV